MGDPGRGLVSGSRDRGALAELEDRSVSCGDSAKGRVRAGTVRVLLHALRENKGESRSPGTITVSAAGAMVRWRGVWRQRSPSSWTGMPGVWMVMSRARVYVMLGGAGG